MSFQLKRKDVKNTFGRIYSAGYCDAHYLTRPFEKCGYMAGVYGWNCDVFSISTKRGRRFGFVTGYRTDGVKALKIDFAILRKYEERARVIFTAPYASWDETKYRKEYAKRINKIVCLWDRLISEIEK